MKRVSDQNLTDKIQPTRRNTQSLRSTQYLGEAKSKPQMRGNNGKEIMVNNLLGRMRVAAMMTGT